MVKWLTILVEWVRNKIVPRFSKYRSKLPYIIIVVFALIVVVVGINVFIELTDTLSSDKLIAYDTKITNYITSFRSPALDSYFITMTKIGDVHGYLIILGIALLLTILVFRKWKYIGQITLVLFLASFSNVILKRVIDRARPDDIEHLVVVNTLSYPSGHAMSAMAFYGFLIFLVSFLNVHKLLKMIIISLLLLLILSIGVSRIYLGVHFPSDIAGGFIAGLIWVFFCIFIFNVIEVFRRDPST
ncbi:phosphatase PAP2 family protein [Psychroserpens sp. XS_ASV72]|uniref:phosphatase PAP2 family protein n=1 Tax=Psychroserpens sp. XS_ASV72 TaxID=3241293 RepID=UPI0035165B51